MHWADQNRAAVPTRGYLSAFWGWRLERVLPTGTLHTTTEPLSTAATWRGVARASTGVTGAHMPGDKTRELWEHLRLPEIKAQLGLKMADSVTSTLRLQLMPVKNKQ